MRKPLPVQVERYLALLPEGFNSYPKARVTAVLFNRICHDEPQILHLLNQTPALVALLTQPLQDTAWVPITLHVSAILALAELRQWSAPQMRAQLKIYGKAILSESVYRHLFHFLSPTLIVMGFADRYRHDFKGVEAKAKQLTQTTARTTIVFPNHLYPYFYVESYNGIFEAALESARASSASSQIESVTPTSCSSLFSWN